MIQLTSSTLADRPRYFALGAIVKISVGSGRERRTWRNLSEELLCHYSSVFRANLRGGFKESKVKAIAYNEEFFHPPAFGTLIHWMYSGGRRIVCREYHGNGGNISNDGMLR